MKVFEKKWESIDEVIKLSKSVRQISSRQKSKDVLVSSTAQTSPLKERLAAEDQEKAKNCNASKTIHVKCSPPQRINFNGSWYKEIQC